MEHKADVIDRKDIALKIRKEVFKLIDITRQSPGLAVVLVGNRKDSGTYVRSKKKACEEVGIISFGIDLAENSSEEEVLKCVQEYNKDPLVHGILVQFPLPEHINEEKILASICVEKDVDGFHPLNIGKLAMQGRKPLLVPCTPKGCIELLLRSGVDIKGKHAVAVGRSYAVGTPVPLLLQNQATVTVMHSYAPNPSEATREADIVTLAVRVALLVRVEWIKPVAITIDVGINAIDNPSSKKGYTLVGDVYFKGSMPESVSNYTSSRRCRTYGRCYASV